MPATSPADKPIAGTSAVKHARVHLRMDGRSKRTLERAAAYEETTVSRFVLSSAIAAAERIIESRGKNHPPRDGLGHLLRRFAQPSGAERGAEGGSPPLPRAHR